MKTLLRIDLDEDNKSLDIELSQNDESIAYLFMALDHLQRQNIIFRAIVSSTFESICKDCPDALEHLKSLLEKKESQQIAFHLTHNPSKS